MQFISSADEKVVVALWVLLTLVFCGHANPRGTHVIKRVRTMLQDLSVILFGVGVAVYAVPLLLDREE